MRRVVELVLLGIVLCGVWGCEMGGSTGPTAEVNPALVQQEDARVAEAEKAEAARQAQAAALP